MKISVVIPLYNKANHIRRAINSVLKQENHEIEVIVIDDGSVDHGTDVVRQIDDPRVRLISQENAGVSAARNRGIAEAKFDYIGLLDADDEWKENFLQEIERLMGKFPGGGVYATGYEIKRPDGITISGQWRLLLPRGWEGYFKHYFRHARRKPLISASSVVIPKEVFLSVGGFTEGIARGEDLEMWCRIALHYPIVFLNRVCVIYYQDAENRACYRQVDIQQSFSNMAEEVLLKNRDGQPREFEEYMLNMMIGKASYLIRDQKYQQAREVLDKCRHTKSNRRVLLKTYLTCYYRELRK